MGPYLTEDDVRGVAEVARIGLTEDELARMTVDLNAIVGSLAGIFEYDLEGVSPTFHPIGGLVNVMREDAETPSFAQRQALSGAPHEQEGFFAVPSILGEDGDR